MPANPFFQTENLKIVKGNVLTTRSVEPGSVELIVTSPPYNVDIDYGTHDDAQSYASYLEFSRRWMARCFEWLRADGRM